MKKKLALFMTMMLMVGMIPFSAFAAEDSDNIYVVDGAPKVAFSDKNEKLMVVIDLGTYTSLRNGNVDITLKNARLANMRNSITYKITQSDKEVTGTTLKFEDRRQEELLGGETDIVMNISGKELENKGQDNIKIFLTMNMNFSESKVGDVDLELTDRNQVGIGNHKETIAYQVGDMQRNMVLSATDSESRVGLDGGSLSAFMITRFDRLDSVKSNNEIVVKLPEYTKFDKATAVKIDGNIHTPKYNSAMTEMRITEVTSASGSVTVEPVLSFDKEKTTGSVEAFIEFKVNSRATDSNSIKIGNVTDAQVDVTVLEKWKKAIPTVSSTDTKTVQVKISGIKESFKKNDYVNFEVLDIEIPYGQINIESPKGKVMVLGDSAGKEAANLVNKKEVYKDGKFSIKILDDSVKDIEFTMEVTAKHMAVGTAYMEISSNQFNTIRRPIANMKQKLSVETSMATGQKGVEFSARDIRIKESEAGSFNTGDKIYISLDKNNTGVNADSIKVQTASGLELSEAKKLQDGRIEFTVLKKSYNAPGIITISNIKVFSLENAVSGVAKIEIKLNEDTIYEGEYVKFLGANDLKDVTVFTLGSKTYTVSGSPREALQAPYIKNGYTMLPVKALADAIGLSSTWDSQNKEAIFSSNGKMVRVKMGEKNMSLNGSPLAMSVPAVSINGTTMIELRSIAGAFGVDIAWDSISKTITVTGK